MNTEHSSANNSVDRILNALRDATPPPGMERRILNVLEAQSPQKIASTSRDSSGSVIPSEVAQPRSRGIPAFRDARTATPLRWTAIAAAIVIAALIARATHHPTQPSTATTQTASAPPQPITNTATVTPATPIRHAVASQRVRPTPSQPAEPPTTEDNAQLSHPAPPIPLTDQERLLLRYARRGRTEDLAQISNDSKAAKEQQDAAEFQAFFKPPITIGESE
jgi:hypothetical protein